MVPMFVRVVLYIVSAVSLLGGLVYAVRALVSWMDMDHGLQFDPVADVLGDDVVRYRKAMTRLDALALIGLMTALIGTIACAAAAPSIEGFAACGAAILGLVMTRLAADGYLRHEGDFERTVGFSTTAAAELLQGGAQRVRR